MPQVFKIYQVPGEAAVSLFFRILFTSTKDLPPVPIFEEVHLLLVVLGWLVYGGDQRRYTLYIRTAVSYIMVP